MIDAGCQGRRSVNERATASANHRHGCWQGRTYSKVHSHTSFSVAKSERVYGPNGPWSPGKSVRGTGQSCSQRPRSTLLHRRVAASARWKRQRRALRWLTGASPICSVPTRIPSKACARQISVADDHGGGKRKEGRNWSKWSLHLVTVTNQHQYQPLRRHFSELIIGEDVKSIARRPDGKYAKCTQQ
uniref:Uncharacterized protein n=1 Tax=Trichuris muris TaxID=70415 RepID=A0A5S6QI48_TRIMR